MHTETLPTRSRPAWIELDSSAAAGNMQRLRAIAGVPVMAVVKANAYGHGALPLARIALANGATWLAVATLDEARALRQADIAAPILILGYTPPWQAAEALHWHITCTVYDQPTLHAFAAAAHAHNLPAHLHVKVDTGMTRLGVLPAQTGSLLRAAVALPGVHLEGLFTHFATADAADLDGARQQLARFEALLDELTAAGLHPPIVHAANSAATLNLPAARFDLVRPGIAYYGLHPDAQTARLPAGFRPVLSLHAEVARVQQVPPGTAVSYGGDFVPTRPSYIATIPLGYGDGLCRTPPWRAALLHGQRVPIVGRVCMDYCMADITDLPNPARVQAGDTLTLVGQQGQATISADEAAAWRGTINYEVVTALQARLPRLLIAP